MSYVQCGNIPVRDAALIPPHAPPGPSADGPGTGLCGVGGNPLWVYFHIGYRILDIYFVNILTNIDKNTHFSKSRVLKEKKSACGRL